MLGLPTLSCDAARQGAVQSDASELMPSQTLKMDPFSVAPGEEAWMCQNFAPRDEDLFVRAFESHITTGVHHFVAFLSDVVSQNGSPEPCSGFEFGITAYGSQRHDDGIVYPEGVAFLIPKGKGLRLQLHFMNTGSEVVTPNVEVTMRLADPVDVQYRAGVMYADVRDFLLPPGETTTVTYRCALPFAMNFLTALPHMHRHGVQFSSTIDGANFVETQQWSEPESPLFDPPFSAREGATFDVTCTYYNSEDFALTNGPSINSNEMCNISTEFYPLPEGVPQSFRCE